MKVIAYLHTGPKGEREVAIAAEPLTPADKAHGWTETPLVSMQDSEAANARMQKTIKNLAHLLAFQYNQPCGYHALTYTNYRGETSERKLYIVRFWYGATEWHTEEQFMMNAFDYDKDAYRDFAVADFSFEEKT